MQSKTVSQECIDYYKARALRHASALGLEVVEVGNERIEIKAGYKTLSMIMRNQCANEVGLWANAETMLEGMLEYLDLQRHGLLRKELEAA